MMKKILLLTFCFLMIPSAAAFAQSEAATPLDPLKIYEDWKRNEFAGQPEIAKHHALAVVTKRTGSDSAELNVAAVGEMPYGFILEIQPLAIIRNDNGQTGYENAGQATTTSLTPSDPPSVSNSPATLTIHVPVAPNADAFQIKWLIPRGNNESGQETLAPSVNTLILKLEDTPQSSVMAIVRRPSR